ncbi:MAG: ABC transporter ATP-binding protein [Ruminococcaceae bacterium]|nr:ABC transporter ATP-binding protein [Oscillospiraceae bacterium]
MDKYHSDARASIGGMRGGGGRGRRGMPPQKAKDFKGTVKMLWNYMGNLKWYLFLIVLISACTSGLGVLIPLIVGRVVDSMGIVPGTTDFPLLTSLLIILAVVYVTDLILIFMQGFIMAGVSQRFVNRLRTELFAKLQKLSLRFFDTHESGDIMSRLTNDMDTISGTVAQSATQLISGVLTVIGTLTMMLVLSPVLSLAVFVTVPLIYLLTKTVTKRTGKLFREQQAYLGVMNSHIEETISGIQTVRAYGREEQVIRHFDEVNETLCDVGTRAHIWSGYIMPLLNVINNFGYVLISTFGGILCLNGLLSAGIIASFVSLAKQFTRPLNEIANTYNTFLSAIAGAERVFEIISEEEEVADRPGAISPEHIEGHVEFRDVSFGYRPDVKVLDHVSIDIKPRMRAAFVGPTGAGKTTIINLLTRFYDVDDGAILLDGVDLRDYTRDFIRSTFGVVLQETYLFGGTVRENIRYGKLDATDEEVERAAKISGADSFITRLEHGYDTIVQDNGANLSAGQRQMLAISRAVLADPPILILDEATSNIDTRTEMHIQKVMAELMRDRTTFVIAHRLGTIRDADVIMVVEGGHIIESGTHDELMRLGGFYHNMYTAQMGLAGLEAQAELEMQNNDLERYAGV